MKVRLLLAASLALAFTTTAFAQDAAPAAAASPADSSAPATDAQAAKPAKPHAMKHRHHAMHHHAAGDPMNIDHSDDKMAVTPTDSKVTLPAPTGN